MALMFRVYHTSIVDGVFGSGPVDDLCPVLLQQHHRDNLYIAFDFAKSIHAFISRQGYSNPMIVIEDENNWLAKIYPYSETLEECLTLGMKGYIVGDRI